VQTIQKIAPKSALLSLIKYTVINVHEILN
jgi:hypothetical protein